MVKIIWILIIGYLIWYYFFYYPEKNKIDAEKQWKEKFGDPFCVDNEKGESISSFKVQNQILEEMNKNNIEYSYQYLLEEMEKRCNELCISNHKHKDYEVMMYYKKLAEKKHKP